MCTEITKCMQTVECYYCDNIIAYALAELHTKLIFRSSLDVSSYFVHNIINLHLFKSLYKSKY